MVQSLHLSNDVDETCGGLSDTELQFIFGIAACVDRQMQFSYILSNAGSTERRVHIGRSVEISVTPAVRRVADINPSHRSDGARRNCVYERRFHLSDVYTISIDAPHREASARDGPDHQQRQGQAR